MCTEEGIKTEEVCIWSWEVHVQEEVVGADARVWKAQTVAVELMGVRFVGDSPAFHFYLKKKKIPLR